MRNDYETIDDRTLNAVQAAKIWRLAPEGLRHGLMNLLYTADERLHDEVVALTAKFRDARPVLPPGQAATNGAAQRLGDAPCIQAATAAPSESILQ
jgi:hypothetical protein